jgi:hypothetical protein
MKKKAETPEMTLSYQDLAGKILPELHLLPRSCIETTSA